MSYYEGGRKGGSSDRNDSGFVSRHQQSTLEKIFVGGLSRDTGDDELRDYFSNFGTVVECMVKRDPNTGSSRGFGFVSFKDSSSVDQVLAEHSHTLQGKKIDPKRAQARNAAGGGPEVCRKIFVGGLDPNLAEEKIREYFCQFGKIALIEQPFDREKNTKKGFCFITFESGDPVDLICVNPKHNLGGRDVDVKKATPKEKQAAASTRGGPGGGRGGGRGGRDGYGGWEAPQPEYGAMPAYSAPYDYSAYYAQQAAVPAGYGAYGQPAPAQYAAVDPYSQAYAPAPVAPTGAYDYSAWYGTAAAQPPAVAQNGGGAVYSRGQRPSDGRYQPY